MRRAATPPRPIAGTGCSDTSRAARDTRLAGDWGADAALVVTPYYNKCTQRGLIGHYTAIADAADIPIIVYNVPSRTGLNMLPETFARLSEHEKHMRHEGSQRQCPPR